MNKIILSPHFSLRSYWFLFLFTVIISAISGCNTDKEDHLLIATAANMQFAMKELTQEFAMSSGIKCKTIISSSGNLTAQIVQGAPYDVFLSADLKYPNELYIRNLTAERPKIYAYGSLVIWTNRKDVLPDIETFAQDDIKVIAIANPDIAPYGHATKVYLSVLDLYETFFPKMVFGESISQTNSFITSKAADIGITSKSTVFAPALKEKGRWAEIDRSLYEEIAQGIVVIERSEKKEDAREFVDFLFSKKGKEILSSFGYNIGNE